MNKAKLRQFFAAISSQLSAMMFGSSFVWFTPLLERLKTEGSRVPMTDVESSWMISLIEIGELFSPIPAGMLLNRIGRKTVLLSSFPFVAISWVLVVYTNTVEYLYVARFIQGFALGIAFTACPAYVAEISEPSIRGALCGNFQTMWSLGILFAYITGSFLSYEGHAYANAAIAFLFGATYIWAPESPYYLLMKNKRDKAKEALIYLRSTNNVDEEMQSIINSLKANSAKSAKWSDLISTKQKRKTLLVVSSVAFVKYMSGISAITTYITETLSRTTGSNLNKNNITIATGVVMVAATIVSAYVVDKIGRRPLIMMSTAGCIIFNAIAGVFFILVQFNVPNITDYAWIVYSSIGIYCIINNIGLSPLLQTLQAECFPSETRGLAGGFIILWGTVLIFFSLKQYQPVEDGIGVYMNYFLFSFYSIVGSIAIFAFMKETAGKTLTQIQESEEKFIKNEVVSPSIKLTYDGKDEQHESLDLK